MSSIGATIRHEMRELIPAVDYFVITFNLIGFTRVLMLREYGITVSTFVGAPLGALLVAKAVLLVGVLPFMEPFPKILILYNVLWKTLLYALAAFMIPLLEEIIRSPLKPASFAPAWDMLWRPQFWGADLAGHGTFGLLHRSTIAPRSQPRENERDIPRGLKALGKNVVSARSGGVLSACPMA